VCADRIPPPTPAGPLEGGAFGELLRRAREAQGIALGAIAERTRIARHHLEALERSDLGALPAGPFGRSYVRAYADVLGVDPDPILEAYRVWERQRGAGTPEGEQRMLEELSHLVGRDARAAGSPARFPAVPARLAAAVAAAGILATLGWLLARDRAPDSAVATSIQPTSVPSPEVAARPRAEPPEPPAATSAGAARDDRPAADAPASSSPPDTLEVSDHAVGTGIVDRRLVGGADRFPEGSRVAFWTQVRGGRPGHVIRHVWFQEGHAVMKANLAIGGPHWRTHSTLVLPRGSAGRWTVEARTSGGRLLARDAFVCEPVEPRRSR
jgi:cytoskeletal protein RodZ